MAATRRDPINGLGVDQAIVQALEREPGRRAARSVHAMRSKACPREDSRRRSSAAFLKFEVDRQLELACIQGGDGLAEGWSFGQAQTVYRVDCGDVRPVQDVELFDDDIHFPVRTLTRTTLITELT